MQQLNWVKPDRCDNSGPNCVEVARDDKGTVHLRDSKNPDGAMLAFTPGEWSAFEESVRAGQQF